MSLTPREAAARAALRARQGKGARYDAPSAPVDDLLLARRATAYFFRKLNELSDPELDLPSSRPGLSRRHLVAFAGYEARMLAELVAWARQGQADRAPRRSVVEAEEIAWGVTLPSHALRHLFQHAVVHLDVEWRDLDDDGWIATIEDSAGSRIAVGETPALRARTLWRLVMDMDVGTRPAEVPAGLASSLQDADDGTYLRVG